MRVHVFVFVVLLLTLGCHSARKPALTEKDKALAYAIPVKTIRPTRDPRLYITVRQPAYVEGFFQADLMAQAAGPVRSITKDIGDSVRFGELLVVLDVPNLDQQVAQSAATVAQRQAELKLSSEQVDVQAQAVEVARSSIDVALANVKQNQATEVYRRSELERFKILAGRNAVTPDVVDEQRKYHESALAGVESAEAAARQTSSTWKESSAKLEAARADVILKRALVDVARQQLTYAQVEAAYGRVTSPFDGVVTARYVDPGSFVQNATNSGGKPFLTLQRNDLVTIVVKVPDNYAAFVTRRTPVRIRMDELPGQEVEATVTRLARSIDNKDRTMRIEVDLFNRPREEYSRFLLQGLATYLSSLASRSDLEAAVFEVAAAKRWSLNLKGSSDLVPAFPKLAQSTRPDGRPAALLPGMYGTMRLILRELHGACLVPSGAIFSRGGKLYVAFIKEDKAQFLPVKVLIDDGVLANVQVIVREGDESKGLVEVLSPLTGDEEVVAAGQGELSEGQTVKPTLSDAWANDIGQTRQ